MMRCDTYDSTAFTAAERVGDQLGFGTARVQAGRCRRRFDRISHINRGRPQVRTKSRYEDDTIGAFVLPLTAEALRLAHLDQAVRQAYRARCSLEAIMRHIARPGLLSLMAILLLTVGPLGSQAPAPQPLARSLDCPTGDCPLLQGTPQTTGMRSGFVRLKPGATVGWHTTGKHEEALVILHGQGEALIDDQSKKSFVAPAFAYIQRAARHNVLNTGKEPLEYVYVVAPAKAQ
jgi:mannose-6-phosphate isomerase-like protein (cupin superfamily)